MSEPAADRPVAPAGLRRAVPARRVRPARRTARRAAVVAAFGGAAVLPFFLPEGSPALDNMVLTATYVTMALGLNVVVGFAGLLDLGYVAFFAIGAHVTATFASTFWAGAGGGHGVGILVGDPVAAAPGIHMNFMIVVVLAVVATTTAGVLIGVPTLRLRGAYVGVVTLAFGEIIGQVAENGGDIHLFGGTLTAGPNGITPIDPIDLPLLAPFDPLDLRPWYWFALALVAAMLVVSFRLRASRIGRAWIALRDDEEAAAGAGVPIARTKLQAYAVGAALGGVTGAFLASYLRTVNPTQFTFSFSIFILAMVVLGGLGSIWGVVLGAIALSELNTWLLPDVLNGLPARVGLDFDPSSISSGIYGLLLLLVLLLRPEGLVAERRAGRRPDR
jgi:branched-chain amino acid transport system permease protein